ncbi:MAG: preprotein translocase subunit SecG [Candidatus Binatus sp.]|uniref:preprotein translocase subunit SecG n=1 Tax=Candidatus Binatus sp. TaxID=2811406 RepID=UPI003BB0B572
MVSIVISIHVIVCVAMVIIILLQQGKGAEVGAVFGGSSQTVFGASGAGNALTKTTWALAIIFFSTSIFLALASSRRVTGSIFEHPFSSMPAGSVMPAKQAPKNANPAAPAPAAANPAAPATPGSTK